MKKQRLIFLVSHFFVAVLVSGDATAAVFTQCSNGDPNCYDVNFGAETLNYETGANSLTDEIPADQGPYLKYRQVIEGAYVGLDLETVGDFASWGLLSSNYTGSRALFNSNDGGISTINLIYTEGCLIGGCQVNFSTPDAFGTFDLVSIDVSELLNKSSYNPTNITFMAEKPNGQAVSTTVSLDEIFGLQTFTFGDEFKGLRRVWWAQTADWHQFDNIALDNLTFHNVIIPTSNVPVPSALWLFGSGLLGLIGISRRKNKQ